MIEGGCTKDQIFGGCPKHPTESMLNCKLCLIEQAAHHPEECKCRECLIAKVTKPPRTCAYIFCHVKLYGDQPDGAYCSAECEREAKPQEYEKVDHPTHYNLHPAGIECIDVIEWMPHNIGAAIKYLWRAGLKPGAEAEEDIKKALWYIERQRTIEDRRKR